MIQFTYTLDSSAREAEIIYTVAQAHNYQPTISVPVLDASAVASIDPSTGATIYETIDNPTSLQDFARSIVDGELKAFVVRCFKKVEDRKSETALAAIRTTLAGVESEKIP